MAKGFANHEEERVAVSVIWPAIWHLAIVMIMIIAIFYPFYGRLVWWWSVKGFATLLQLVSKSVCKLLLEWAGGNFLGLNFGQRVAISETEDHKVYSKGFGY